MDARAQAVRGCLPSIRTAKKGDCHEPGCCHRGDIRFDEMATPRFQLSPCTRYIGVLYYLLERDRDLVRTINRGRYLSLRGPPGRVPSACHPPQSSQTLTTSTNNTMVIHSEVLGFVLAPSRGPASAGKGSRAIRRRPPCPRSTAGTCRARISSSSI